MAITYFENIASSDIIRITMSCNFNTLQNNWASKWQSFIFHFGGRKQTPCRACNRRYSLCPYHGLFVQSQVSNCVIRQWSIILLSNVRFWDMSINILNHNFRNAIPEPGSENHKAFMESRILHESEHTNEKTSNKNPRSEL